MPVLHFFKSGSRGEVFWWGAWAGLDLGVGIIVMFFDIPFLSKKFVISSVPSFVCVVAVCSLVPLSIS